MRQNDSLVLRRLLMPLGRCGDKRDRDIPSNPIVVRLLLSQTMPLPSTNQLRLNTYKGLTMSETRRLPSMAGIRKLRSMSDQKSRARPSVVSAATFFVLVVFFQGVFELIFGDPIDARFLLQAVLAAAIITALNVLFERRRKRP